KAARYNARSTRILLFHAVANRPRRARSFHPIAIGAFHLVASPRHSLTVASHARDYAERFSSNNSRASIGVSGAGRRRNVTTAHCATPAGLTCDEQGSGAGDVQ